MEWPRGHGLGDHRERGRHRRELGQVAVLAEVVLGESDRVEARLFHLHDVQDVLVADLLPWRTPLWRVAA
jgi:hypothetical protein